MLIHVADPEFVGQLPDGQTVYRLKGYGGSFPEEAIVDFKHHFHCPHCKGWIRGWPIEERDGSHVTFKCSICQREIARH